MQHFHRTVRSLGLIKKNILVVLDDVNGPCHEESRGLNSHVLLSQGSIGLERCLSHLQHSIDL